MVSMVTFTNEQLFTAGVLLLGIFLLYLIVRELRLMRTSPRKLELELEKEKLAILREDIGSRGYPFTRMSSEQLESLKQVDEENFVLETNIYAREKMVESRLKRLENYVKLGKLEKLMEKIQNEEKKTR